MGRFCGPSFLAGVTTGVTRWWSWPHIAPRWPRTRKAPAGGSLGAWKNGHAPSAPLLVPGGPRPEIFKAEDRGELRWGGCLIDSGSPGWYCKKRDLSFGGRDEVHVAKQGSEPHPTVPILDHIRLVILGSRLPCFSGAAISAEMGPAEMLGRSPHPWHPTLRRPCGTPVEPSHVNARARSKKIS